MLKKFCSSCGRLVSHDHACHISHRAEGNKKYDKEKRTGIESAYYKSDEWTSLREHVLDLYNHIDVVQFYTTGRIVTANTVHHIKELRESYEERNELYNLIPMSSSCHQRISMMYKKDKEGTQRTLNGFMKRWWSEHKPIPPALQSL